MSIKLFFGTFYDPDAIAKRLLTLNRVQIGYLICYLAENELSNNALAILKKVICHQNGKKHRESSTWYKPKLGC